MAAWLMKNPSNDVTSIAKNVMVPRSARTRPANALPAVCPVSTTVSRVSITLMAIGQTILCPNNFHDSNIINGKPTNLVSGSGTEPS